MCSIASMARSQAAAATRRSKRWMSCCGCWRSERRDGATISPAVFRRKVQPALCLGGILLHAQTLRIHLGQCAHRQGVTLIRHLPELAHRLVIVFLHAESVAVDESDAVRGSPAVHRLGLLEPTQRLRIVLVLAIVAAVDLAQGYLGVAMSVIAGALEQRDRLRKVARSAASFQIQL